jgi:hypothetical protein
MGMDMGIAHGHGTWQMAQGTGHTDGVWRVACGVWCVVCGVCGVWRVACVACGVWRAVKETGSETKSMMVKYRLKSLSL